MDNICHTLVGAALARTGLGRRTSLGAATMMLGANFPDIDILTAPFGRATEMRRGLTHGVLALVVLPFVLTAIMITYDRWLPASRRSGRTAVVPRELLLLATLSILTHPLLDWMNSYGLRWLMPFDGTWFYGDSLFIIDPWLLLVLGAGVWLSRRRERAGTANPWTPPRIAVGFATVYIVAMLGLQDFAERIARREVAGTGRAESGLIVTASPANPFRWRVHADEGNRYWMGAVSVVERSVSFDLDPLEKNAGDPASVAASRDPRARAFLDWARLPFYRVIRNAERTAVTITDARYGASIEIEVD